jgi:glycosyltransferase involved in cell wall biosynthesis
VRIGIDARELCGRATGVGRYLSGLLAEWARDERARRHEFVLYAPEPLPLTLDSRRFPTRVVPGGGGSVWEQITFPAKASRDHLDVLFAPAYTMPLFRRMPTVVAIHDVSFAAHPEWFSTREGARRRWLSRQAALQARAVITISRFSERELIDRFAIPSSKIHVVPPGVTSPRALGAATSVAGSPAAAPTLLFVGSIFNRRHVPELIRAFAPIARNHPQASLDLVGDNRSYPRQNLQGLIERERLTASVRWRRWVDDAELGRLYGEARAFAFLSEYEGLGLTPLEALAAGVPPVLLDTPVARESCVEAAVYVPRIDIPVVTDALERVLFDEETRRRILAAAPAALSRYTWARAATETLRVLEGAA